MKKIFIISDTHFNHKEIISFENRKVGFEKEIIRKWNNNVSDDDIVIHLGDVIFDRPSELKKYLSVLKGTKILVRGNHDKKSILSYLNYGFSFVCDEVKFNNYCGLNLIFSHIPLKRIKKGYINIHGHLHSALHRKDIKLTKRHILYNPEKSGFNYMPIILDNLIKNEKR